MPACGAAERRQRDGVLSVAWRGWPTRNTVLAIAAWLALLALLPWWFGLPLLLALAAVVALLQYRMAEYEHLIRRGLRWGLPGVLFALQRALGGDVLAWGAALLGALAGYTMLAGLEAWLDRELRRAPPGSMPDTEWLELARAPIGPPARIIELEWPVWLPAAAEFADPRGGVVHYRAGSYRFADGMHVDEACPQYGFSPAGHWFVSRDSHAHQLILCDRDRRRCHRLNGWQLCGWDGEQAWLNRRDDDMPLALDHVLGRDDPAHDDSAA